METLEGREATVVENSLQQMHLEGLIHEPLAVIGKFRRFPVSLCDDVDCSDTHSVPQKLHSAGRYYGAELLITVGKWCVLFFSGLAAPNQEPSSAGTAAAVGSGRDTKERTPAHTVRWDDLSAETEEDRRTHFSQSEDGRKEINLSAETEEDRGQALTITVQPPEDQDTAVGESSLQREHQDDLLDEPLAGLGNLEHFQLFLDNYTCKGFHICTAPRKIKLGCGYRVVVLVLEMHQRG